MSGFPLSIAAVQGHGVAHLSILLDAAGIAWVMWNRLQGRAVALRRLVLLPAIFLVIGIENLSAGHAYLGASATVFIGISSGLSLLLGAARGLTIHLFERDGVLWQRYRPVTVALWLTLIASKVVLALIATSAHAGLRSSDLLLSLGLSLAAESAVVFQRAQRTGLPFAPDPRAGRHGEPSSNRRTGSAL